MICCTCERKIEPTEDAFCDECADPLDGVMKSVLDDAKSIVDDATWTFKDNAEVSAVLERLRTVLTLRRS